jgi:phenylacetate-CoA ligase
LLEARSRRWYGTSYRDRWAILGGQLIADVRAERPPYWVHNFGLNQLYLSAFHIKPSTVAAYLKALRDFGATHIICYPSALFVLAKLAEEQGLQAPQLRFVYTNAEAVLPSWRATIQRVFQCPLQSTYGMTEIALAGSECVEGNIHLWPETGILEIFDPQLDQLAVPGEAGRYIITGLLSPDMLFIRYEIGDWGKGIKQELCACGRLLPIFDEIGGRIGNQLYTPDGRAIFWANNIFGALHIQELQVVQEALDCLRVNVVPAADYSPLDHDLIVEKLHQRVGYDTRVEVVVVKEISRGANGKFQPVVSKLT